ncbi:MAG: AraC family transcriptional regulator [Alphaproteobacteria bacterium]|nr:AraC family transcriptional regulator [Alphaproteobacteria bacterium]
MQKNNERLNEIKLVGITTRTNNAHLFKADPETNKVAATVQKYFHQGLAQNILHRKRPGTTYCAYTEYESDLNGDFTYFIGEEVVSFDNVPEGFKTLIIPSQDYLKLTNSPGPMPDVCINSWKNVWQMSPQELGGQRAYQTDFELYDERASDHQNVILDLYIGLKP